uniref:G-protein coupled receptors family 1 profile domain-containing protein n=1 Tax=Romanomermis culicivorax TaxID=13658 RepID=A0A915JDN1_ROMCU
MCNSTEQLIRNQIFWTGEGVKLILAVSGLMFNGLFIRILYRSSRNFDFSYNCSILINISISYIFLTFGSLCKSIFTISAVLSEHWCWISVPYYALCQFQEAVHLVGQLPALLSFCLLAVERLWAKFALDVKNDHQSSIVIDGHQHQIWNCFFDTCLILSWGVSLTAALVVGLTIDQNQKAPYCTGFLLMDARLILGTVTVVPACFVLSTALYVILWYKTNRRLKSKYTLF